MRCLEMHESKLYKVNESLCHPGVTRLFHFLHSKNLPYSMEDVRRKAAQQRQVRAEIKPNIYRVTTQFWI